MNIYKKIRDTHNEDYMHICVTEDGDIFPLQFAKPTDDDLQWAIEQSIIHYEAP